MAETLREKEAFEFYYKQGNNRSYMSVARQFNVSDRTVNRWAKKHGWQERLQLRDQNNAKELERRTDKTVVDQKAELLTVVRYAIFGQGQFADRLRKGEIKAENVFDFNLLFKNMLLLLGEETERTEGKYELNGELHKLITDPEFVKTLQRAKRAAATANKPDNKS